jgi:transcriptional regulator with XRE-family HTH domain
MQEFRYKEFGTKVRLWRQSLQPPMTQRSLARLIGVSDGFLTHIETGRTLPSVRTMVSMSRELGVPLTDILTAAGHLDHHADSRDDLLQDPELRLFFRDDWPRLSDDERELLFDFIRMLKTRVRRRRPRGA